ncbi:MAG: hypothetical protein KDA78_17935 [Planctomycetaceae bacterium]|nr:hypothetical protein [Planctomycetaceae bacterium]
MKTLIIPALLALLLTGCTSTSTTNTPRSAKEQMLVSNAVDQALNKVDFTPFSNRSVYLEEKYVDCVDKTYVISSIRHRLLNANATLVAKPEEADLIVEPRSGAVGTHSQDAFLGIPEIVLPGMLTLPETRLVERKNQMGIAKIGLVAYDAKTKKGLGSGGVSLAQSDDSAYFVVGIGPYQSGSINSEIKTGKKASASRKPQSLPQTVAFSQPYSAAPEPGSSKLRLASGQEPVKEAAKEPGGQTLDDAPPWAK